MIRRACLTIALLGAAAPALAAPFYQAEPAAQPRQALVVTRDNVWRCGAAGCTSERVTSRPAIVCATLVREVGALRSFSADGHAFGADELEACNRRARAG